MENNYDKLKCPGCGSEKVTVAHTQKFIAKTFEHYCHSAKTHDGESPSNCLECGWTGRRDQLVEVSDQKLKRRK